VRAAADEEAPAQGWGRYRGFLELVGRPAYAVPDAVHKTEGWTASAEGAEGESAQRYVDAFEVMSKADFEQQLGRLADALGDLEGPYACVVSPAGKSNFWVTGKVLQLAEGRGARPPTQIIEVPVKEQDVMVIDVAVELDESVATVVYLDDASYSGSQLGALVARLERALRAAVPAREVRHLAGLVAASETAEARVRGEGARLLTAPARIREAPPDGPAEAVDLDASHAQGHYLMAMPYKVPDHASVRDALLTDPARGAVDGAPTPAVTGYNAANRGAVEMVRSPRGGHGPGRPAGGDGAVQGPRAGGARGGQCAPRTGGEPRGARVPVLGHRGRTTAGGAPRRAARARPGARGRATGRWPSPRPARWGPRWGGAPRHRSRRRRDLLTSGRRPAAARVSAPSAASRPRSAARPCRRRRPAGPCVPPR
jgi:hypothetical protein